MQSAFNVAPLHTSLPGFTAVEPVAGESSEQDPRIAGSVLPEVSGPIAFPHRRDLGDQVPGTLATAPIPPPPV
jgi:hypothetical protein